jgi:hypothetical protein
MTAEEAKEAREISIFREFVDRSKLPVVPASVESRKPPEPDILCEIAGEGKVAFEMVELCDADIAMTKSLLRKKPDLGSVFLYASDPTENTVRDKILKTYNTGYSIDLLCYTDARLVTPDDMAEEAIACAMRGGTGPFSRIWFMGETVCVRVAPLNV